MRITETKSKGIIIGDGDFPDWMAGLVKKFQEFPKALNPALKRIARKLCTIGLKVMRAKVPYHPQKKKRGQKVISVLIKGQTGLLKKSLGSKVGISKKTKEIYAYIGPRRKSDGFITDVYNPITKQEEKSIPAKYAHLVDRGFNLKLGGRKLKHVPGVGFVRAANDEIKPYVKPMTVQILQEELDKQKVKKQTRKKK